MGKHNKLPDGPDLPSPFGRNFRLSVQLHICDDLSKLKKVHRLEEFLQTHKFITLTLISVETRMAGVRWVSLLHIESGFSVFTWIMNALNITDQ